MGLIKPKKSASLEELTADATATASDIKSGITAYSQGAKITGNYTPPTLASLTADATATASDLLTGKTAYSQGVKITGVYNPFVLTPNLSNVEYIRKEFSSSEAWTFAFSKYHETVLLNDIEFNGKYGSSVDRCFLGDILINGNQCIITRLYFATGGTVDYNDYKCILNNHNIFKVERSGNRITVKPTITVNTILSYQYADDEWTGWYGKQNFKYSGLQSCEIKAFGY